MRIKNDFVDAYYTAAIAEAGDLDGAKLRLIMGDFDETTAIAGDEGDLTVPTYTTYADATMTGASVNVDSEGKSYIQWAATEYVPTADTNLPQSIYGCAILASDDTLLAVSKFDAPASLLYADQVMTVLPKFRLGDTLSNNIVATVE